MRPFTMHLRGQRSALLLVAMVVVGGACVPGEQADAGPEEPTCTGGETPAVRAGHTGVDFVPIEEGDELPAWTRPQGGIGTRINVKLEGYPKGEGAVFESITVQFLGTSGDGASCGDDVDAGPLDDADGGAADGPCTELEVCDNGRCRLLLGNQTNVRFPLECLADNTLHIQELPVRFRNQFQLSALDGVQQELRLIAVPLGGPPMTSSIDVVLNVGDFIQPSWWETGQP